MIGEGALVVRPQSIGDEARKEGVESHVESAEPSSTEKSSQCHAASVGARGEAAGSPMASASTARRLAKLRVYSLGRSHSDAVPGWAFRAWETGCEDSLAGLRGCDFRHLMLQWEDSDRMRKRESLNMRKFVELEGHACRGSLLRKSPPVSPVSKGGTRKKGTEREARKVEVEAVIYHKHMAECGVLRFAAATTCQTWPSPTESCEEDQVALQSDLGVGARMLTVRSSRVEKWICSPRCAVDLCFNTVTPS